MVMACKSAVSDVSVEIYRNKDIFDFSFHWFFGLVNLIQRSEMIAKRALQDMDKVLQFYFMAGGWYF